MKPQLERLADLTRSIEQMIADQTSGMGSRPRAKRALARTGRFAMRPNFRNWKVKGTRPTSDRGVTFHFQHKFVTKGRHVSKGYTDQTPAAAHQAYIERPSAVERVTPEIWDDLGLTSALAAAAREEHARASGSDAPPEFAPAETVHDQQILSFGTVGATRPDRVEFWRKVEALEGRRGRVQCRIIAELPHELGPAARLQLARDFCRLLEEKNLPYWCTIHAPSGHNDARNYHLHIAYYDRPCLKAKDGRWDFEIEQTRRMKNRRIVRARPYKQNKDRAAQGRPWIMELRRHFADVSNFHLAIGGAAKRYDPRSYRESGIAKQPTLHLGTKASVVEVYGIDTAKGQENIRREVAFRLAVGETVFQQRAEHATHLAGRIVALQRHYPDLPAADQALARLAEHQRLSDEGRAAWRKKEIHDIAREAVTLRPDLRRAFLAKEGERLVLRPPAGRETDAWAVAMALEAERELIDAARTDLAAFTAACQRISAREAARLDAVDRTQRRIVDEVAALEHAMLTEIGRRLGRPERTDARKAQHALDLAFRVGAEAAANKDVDLPTLLDESFSESVQRLAALAASSPKAPGGGSAAEGSSRRSTEARPPQIQSPAPDSATARPGLPPSPATGGNAGEITRRRRPSDGGIGGDAVGGAGVEDKNDAPRHERTGLPASASTRPAATPVADNPVERALRALLGTEAPRRGTRDFPGALALPPGATPSEIRAFETVLDTFTNRELRARCFATRDAADLVDDPQGRARYGAAFEIMRDMAGRRGLDLDTGIHDPAKATDIAYARRHTDSEASLHPSYERQRAK